MTSGENTQAFRKFIELCLAQKDTSLSIELFDLFFTPEEKEDLATRYLIIQALLKQEKTQRDISKALNVSISKITRGSNELKRISAPLLHYLKKALK